MDSVQIYLGADGVKQAYNESLGQSSLDIVCLADKYEHAIGDYFDTQFAPHVYGKIKTREILPDTPANRASADSKNQTINAVRYLKRGMTSESDMLLWDDRVILISFGEPALAIVIHQQELVKSLRIQFESLWERLA